MNESQRTSISLLQQLGCDDPNGWDRFTRLYTPLVYGWCRQCGVDADTAGDLSQDVFVSVHRNIGNFQREHSGHTFRGWLWVITRNKVRDHFRRMGDRPKPTGGSTANLMIHQIPDEEPDSTTFAAGKHNTLLARAVTLIQAEFEPKTWQAFWRTKIDEVPTAVVSSELDMSQNAIRKARFRVLKRLREELEELVGQTKVSE